MSVGPSGGTRAGGREPVRGLLLGRVAECARLDALLKGARGERSGVVVVRGEAGVGKTALLGYAARQAAGMTVLRARGVEAESGLAFAGLDELLRPVLGFLGALPERQAAALRGALALEPSSGTDRFAVYVATLGLLAAAAEEAPVLALVDDAQWLDGSSAEALLFAARRLEAEGIVLVFATREGDRDEFDAPGLDGLRVGGLDREEAGRLLQAYGAGPVAPVVAERLAGETAGNPLALIELGELLTVAQLGGEQALGEPLAAGDAARRAFVRRAEALSALGRGALVAAAAAGDGELAPLTAALEGLGIGAAALGEVEAAGLVSVAGGRLAFRHPLVRSAVYAAAEPAERRAAHRALADALGEQRPDRRAWHLAATAFGPDEQVAAALEHAAGVARRRSGYAAAAQALERAAELTPPGGRRVQRLVAGAEAARQAGQPEHALALLQEAAKEATEPGVRADISGKRGRLEWFRGRARRAERLYLDAARLLEPANPAGAVLLLVEASLAARDAGDAAGALATARRACAGAGQRGDGADVVSEMTLGAMLYWAGEAAEAHRRVCHAIATLQDRHIAEVDPEAVLFAARWGASAGIAVERTRLLVDRLLEEARADGALGLLPWALHVSVRLLLREGEWARAYAAAAEGARIAAEVGNVLQRHWLLGFMALIEAAQGRDQECRAHADQALTMFAGTELTRRPELGDALGLLELGAGRPQEALRHLEAATAARGAAGGDKRLARPSLGDLVEAHVRTAGAVPQELMAAVARAGEGDFEGCTAVAARCRALVAGDEEFDARFARALELHGSAWPFARARTQLCYGERLRRAGRRIDARIQLHAALETFERLVARPWAERAAGELRASGERIRRRDPTAAERLTPQELQIALTVAAGATNREAGATLFLSPKTIEHHLGRAYRKLGIRSRVELTHALHDALAPAGGP